MQVVVSPGKEDIMFNVKYFSEREELSQFHSQSQSTCCSKCNNIGHVSEKCPTQRCFKCRGYGHTQYACANKRTGTDDPTGRFKNFRKRSAGANFDEDSLIGEGSVESGGMWERGRSVRRSLLRTTGVRSSNWRVVGRSESSSPQQKEEKESEYVLLSKMQK